MSKYKESIIEDFCGDINGYFNNHYDTISHMFIGYSYSHKKFILYGGTFEIVKPGLNKLLWNASIINSIGYIIEHIGWFIENYNIEYRDILFLLFNYADGVSDDLCLVLNKDVNNADTINLKNLP